MVEHSMRSVGAILAVALAVTARPAVAQSAAEHIALGDSAFSALHPDQAVQHFQAAIAADSTSYEALWKAARAIADVAKQLDGDDDRSKARRDSMYTVARGFAERAVTANPRGADGHYVVAMVLGRLSRTKGKKERVKFAKVIFDEATQAVAIQETHDGAHHVLGAWHAEVKRLSGLQRFFAKALFGGGFMDAASWDKAVEHLERAVAIKPQHIYHRLELAEVYIDLDRYTKARELLTSIASLPVGDVMDRRYQSEAQARLQEIRDKKDKS
jgi:tetratricopeptide (TPR) repeat protein